MAVISDIGGTAAVVGGEGGKPDMKRTVPPMAIEDDGLLNVRGNYFGGVLGAKFRRCFLVSLSRKRVFLFVFLNGGGSEKKKKKKT